MATALFQACGGKYTPTAGTRLGSVLTFIGLLACSGQAMAYQIGQPETISINATVLDSVSISGNGILTGDFASPEEASMEEILIIY